MRKTFQLSYSLKILKIADMQVLEMGNNFFFLAGSAGNDHKVVSLVRCMKKNKIGGLSVTNIKSTLDIFVERTCTGVITGLLS